MYSMRLSEKRLSKIQILEKHPKVFKEFHTEARGVTHLFLEWEVCRLGPNLGPL